MDIRVESAYRPHQHADSFYSDEKFHMNHGTIEVQGDVSDEARIIDLGEDGKERPISMCYLLLFV